MWLERYLNGDHVQVWTEITGLGPDLSARSDALADAAAVAAGTMRRASRNVERLLELLPTVGYDFTPAPDQPTFSPPEPGIALQLVELERHVGRLPLALRAWYQHVGRVNLVGHNPSWRFDYLDPLVVGAPVDFVLAEHAEWNQDRGTEWDQGRFVIGLAPDYLHKANVSGGGPYGIGIPNEGADGLFLFERHQTTFVNYLRIAFRWGGMPGWDPAIAEGWAAPPGPPPPELAKLAAQLEPL